MARERFSPERTTCMNSFPFEQKARYLPSGEIAAESKGLSHEYEVNGLKEISFGFSGWVFGCRHTCQTNKNPITRAERIPAELSFQARERIRRVKSVSGSGIAASSTGLESDSVPFGSPLDSFLF